MSNMLSDAQLERSVLGACILDENFWADASAILDRRDFFLDSHQKIWTVFADLMAQGKNISDYTLVFQEFNRRSWMQAIGGAAYYSDLTTGIPRKLNSHDMIERLIEKRRLRQIMQLCEELTTGASSGAMNSLDAITSANSRLSEIVSDSEAIDEPLVSAYSSKYLDEWLEDRKLGDRIVGLSYGDTELDRLTDGMHKGEVTVVGARSGVGKSTLMLQSAAVNCRSNIPVHLFSLEMSRKQCLQVLWCFESGVPAYKLRKPGLTNLEEAAAVQSAMMRVAEWPLRIHDKGDMQLSQISALLRLSIRRYGTQLFAVDYAQNVRGSEKEERIRVANVSRELTAIAKDEGAHLMMLSQLSKVSREFYSSPPKVTDLRETGQIENDAHTVMLLHRPWDEESGCIKNSGEIIIPKQRFGTTAVIPVDFDPMQLQWRSKC